jgi:eukaryotic-like serine/threonine-protein kinase
MSLSAGDRLGPYEILAPLGAGGLGQVWKARDPRLDRIVAIKVSHEQFSERFELEARAVAALNHPHICQLYDVGPDYLVMEFVDGVPLKGPLPLEKAVEYAAQILDALDAAHQKGITHRDLKPDNILVTKKGIKLLDFGLAKRQSALKETDATLTHAMTQQGQILGTFQYMSPEQLQGKEVDSRSDLFSFGCVLYETLTSKVAFEGQSTASVIAAILEREPAPLTVAPRLERIVKRSLAKDPDQRFQTARDLKAALMWAMENPPASGPVIAGRRWRWLAAAALAIGGLGGWGASILRQPPASETVRLAINPPANTIFSGPSNATVPIPQFAVSPDGRSIAFIAATPSERTMVWLRSMDDIVARPLPGTENAGSPFWSPDGRWVAFFSDGKLKKIPVGGGPVHVITSTASDRGASWGPDDTILISSGNTGLMRVASSGGAVIPVTQLDLSRQEGSHRWPHFLPDGRHFLYLIRSAVAEYHGIYVGSLDGKTKRLLLPTDSNVFYMPAGYLFYTQGDMLLAQPFDSGRLELSGQPLTVAERVGHGSQGNSAFTVSPSGVLAYAGPILRGARLTWMDRAGKNLGSVATEGDYADFRLSRDEKQLTASLLDPKTGNADIWLTDLARGSTSRLTFGPTVNASAVWSPDGQWIAYRTVRQGVAELYQRSASGGGTESRILSEAMQRQEIPQANNSVPTDWSPDGKHVLFSTILSNTQLWMLPLSSAGGDGKPFRFLTSSSDGMHGNFSPDGSLVAYTSNESGRFEVHVQTFPRSDRKWQVSTAGGYEPRWRGDGRELYYLAEDRRLMAVSVDSGTSFGVPKALFQTGVLPGVNAQRMRYVPSRDGNRFLVNTQSADPPPNPITLVLNWTAGLKK